MGCLSIKNRLANTVIFDFDGTLALLNIDFNRMRRDIGALITSHGIDNSCLNQSYVLELIDEAAKIIGQRSNDEEKVFRNDAYRIIEEIEVAAAKKGKLFETTKHLLATLDKAAVRTGIITRNCRKAVRTVFPDIASYCRVVITREDVHKAKPHPEQIQLALDRLGAAAEFSVMVGDHPLDIETGRRGGTLTAGVLTGYFQEADFARAHANVVLTQAADLLAYLAPRPFPD